MINLDSLYPYLYHLSSDEKERLKAFIQSERKSNAPTTIESKKEVLLCKKSSSLFKTLYLTIAATSRNARALNNDVEYNLAKQIDGLKSALEKNFGPPQPIDKIYKNHFDEKTKEGVRKVYNLTVGRNPNNEEIDIWIQNFCNGVGFHEFFLGMLSSEEANSKPAASNKTPLINLCDGEFIQTAYEILLGRGAQAWEIDLWRDKIEKYSMNRTEIISEIFRSAYQIQKDIINSTPHDGLSCLVMGTGSHISVKDWEYKASIIKKQADKEKEKPSTNYHRFYIKSEPRYLVSALASLYCGGDFIDQFMENITEQDGFSDYCELIIVDADSPENEYETIKHYLSRYKNIKYIRANYRIGIYDAWNVAAKSARGEYLTNTNLDDLRRKDSLVLQAGVLENLSFVDVVYQELYYTFDPRLSFEEIAEFGLQTTLPIITPHNMLEFNSPHNAPMWRKKLHDELGFFETRYRSAGDYEFWLRCLSAGKKFYKINDPHVVYYQNPKGLSTRPDTRGLAESCEILKTYARKLVPAEVVMPRDKMVDKLNILTGSTLEEKGDRYDLVQSSLRELAISKKYSRIL